MQTAELDLLDLDPFDLIEDEEPFVAPAKQVDAAASVAELLERALKVIAEFEESSRRPARKPRPARKARVTAHLPGQHRQQDHAGGHGLGAIKGLKIYSAAEYNDTYGDVQDDAGINLTDDVALVARYFDSGDMHVSLHLEDGSVQVLEEMDPDSMRQLAYNLEDVLAVDETQFEGGDPYGIVADADSSAHGFYVAKDGVGDIQIRPPDVADEDFFEISAEDATDFVNALLDMADAYEAHFADDSEVVAGQAGLSRRKPVVAHLPGEHNQLDHAGGGRKKAMPSAPKADMPKAPTEKKAPTPHKRAVPKAKPSQAEVDQAKLKLDRAVQMHGSDRSKWLKKDREAAAKLDKLIADGEGQAEPEAKPEPKVAAPKAPARKRAAPKASPTERTGDAALAVPPRNLEAMTAANDPRADALWYRNGDNSAETASGRPGSFEMSAQMRGQEKMTPQMKARVKAIDSAMAESKLPEPILVYRGAEKLGGVRPDEAIGEGRNLVGREFTDKAFASTTADAAHASWFGATVLRIKVPEGTSAIRMADRKGTERDQQESEILLDRGLTYRVVAQYGRGELKGDWGGAYVLDVEVVR